MRYVPLIIKNSLRNRRRSVLTIISLTVSLCLLGVLLGMYHALFLADAPPSQALRLITHHRVSLAQPMPASYEAKIRQVPGVRAVMVWQWFGGTYIDARHFFARFAVEPDQFFTIRTDLELPDDQKQAFLHERTGCIVSRGLADKYSWKLGDRITLVGDIFPVDMNLKVVGIYTDPEGVDGLFFNKEYLHQSMPLAQRDIVSSYSLIADSPEAARSVGPAIDALFENAPQPTRTESERAFGLAFISFLGNIKLFLLSICGAVTFTILLVSGNTMAMSVRERIREVGILKTLGFTPGSILGIVLGEAGVIALIGGICGTFLAAFLMAGVRQMPLPNQSLKTLSMSPEVASTCIGIALAVGLLSSLIPAWTASRTKILDSLRYSG